MKRLILIAAALFALLAVVETAAALLRPARVAKDTDWQAAARAVRAEFRPGDLIVFAPAWADPIGRMHLGDLVGPEMAGRSDADRYGRIFEVSVRGARAAEALAVMAAGAKLEAASDHGRVHVARYRNAPPAPVEVLYDFTARLGDSIVTTAPRDGRGDEVPCFNDSQDNDDGRRCQSTRVARRTLEIDYRPRRGVLAPVAERMTTRIEYPAAPLGARLVVYAGIHDYYSRKNADGRVELVTYVDDTPVLRTSVGNTDAWKRHEIDTGRFAGAPHRVRFEIGAPSAAWRTFGMHAEARR